MLDICNGHFDGRLTTIVHDNCLLTFLEGNILCCRSKAPLPVSSSASCLQVTSTDRPIMTWDFGILAEVANQMSSPPSVSPQIVPRGSRRYSERCSNGCPHYFLIHHSNTWWCKNSISTFRCSSGPHLGLTGCEKKWITSPLVMTTHDEYFISMPEKFSLLLLMTKHAICHSNR